MSQIISPVKRFWRLLKPDRKDISRIYFYAIFTGLLNLTLPLGISAIINLIMSGQLSTSWLILVIFVIAGIAGTGLLQILQFRLSENIEQRIFTRSSFEFAYRVPRIRLEALYGHYAPELMNRFFDTLSIQKGLAKILIDFPSASLQVLFGLILLSIYNPFFIVFSLILLFLLWVIFRFTGRQGLETSLTESKFKYKVAHWLEEIARANHTFKLAGKTDLHLQKVDTQVSAYLESREAHFKVLIRQYGMLVVFKVLVAAGLLILGAILVINKQLNIGQFVAAEIIVLLVLNSIEKLILHLRTIYDVLTALEKMGQLTDMELEKTNGFEQESDMNKQGMEVELKNVRFCYPDMRRPVIKDFNMNIQSGLRVVIEGPNGSGKSTLLHLLAGLFDIQEGNILFDKRPIGELNYDELRADIGAYLSQDVLFEGSLLENISLGREKANMESVREAISICGLEDFVAGLPKGLHSIIDPDGRRLPRSIVNKIILARCIADNPRLLLLEDPLEHVSGNEGKEIIRRLTDPDKNWTLISISGDPAFRKYADQIFLMQDGTLIHPSGKDQNDA